MFEDILAYTAVVLVLLIMAAVSITIAAILFKFVLWIF